jgi:tetratricopeptide (TPR) repeat protein
MEATRAAPKPKQDLVAADSGDSIIVTAFARRGGAVPDRGDWNACTINDPRRSLAACKYLINPGAKGIKGQAAAHLADGLSLAWQGIMDRAIAAFDQAIAIAPKSSLAYLNRGLAYRRQGDVDRALADLDKAVRLAPNAARGYYNRSLLLRERGDTRRAEADQLRAVSLNADYEEVIH